ncbi:TPA: host cell division inhibitor Icd-like protein [Escherichia coli]|nr:host cell division inhibitor Icd-like protein [Escherichia coli]HBV0521123.1 host cell division inhibitor Icd-like protein [Escherichia coli]HCO5917195.1 host cell division inhibitor Icd-like protein [Escherichia coli]HCO5951000.1 host cell division inhibitor Icd-like protein [Escherichia coli]HCO6100470.1 host cell division inhibitor Icd-like protein [Escherichia coli]
MNTGYTPVQGRGFVRPENQNLQNFAEIIPVISGLIGGSETNIVNARALQMFDDEKGVNLTYTPDGNQNMSIISESVFYKLIKTKSAPLPERPCEQLTCCEKNGSVQGNYINRVAKRHNCRITGKTKATRDGGPSTQATRYPQRMSIANNATFAAGGQCDQCAGLLVGYSCSLALRRWRRLISPRMAALINCPVLSPSSFTFSMPSIISWAIRAVTDCDFAFFGPVAMSNSLCFWCKTIYTKKNYFEGLTCKTLLLYIVSYTLFMQGAETTKPRTVGAVTGLLTTNDSRSIEVAMLNHTTHPQGRDSHNLNKYIWRFIALSTAQPRVIHIEATSEQEARQQSPAGCVMVFAARIRQGVRHVQ